MSGAGSISQRLAALGLLLSIGLALPVGASRAESILLQASPPIGLSRLPDEGIRRRLEGCWALPAIHSNICFDGADNVEIPGSDATGPSRPGTYTVIAGRLFLDLSPNDNPTNEVYASCAVRISSHYRPGESLNAFALGNCANWDVLALASAFPVTGEVQAKLTQPSWLMSELYRHSGQSVLDADLKGCWDAQPDRDRVKYVHRMKELFGGYLSSYEICFDGNKSGTTLSTTFDAGDGWDSVGTFRIVDGWLELLSGPPGDDTAQRCRAVVDHDRLLMDRCALWWKGENGKWAPGHALDPTLFARNGNKPLLSQRTP